MADSCEKCGRPVKARGGVVKQPCAKCRKGKSDEKEQQSEETPATDGTNLRRFRAVAAAVGADADAVLEEFAGEWLKGVRAALDEAEA